MTWRESNDFGASFYKRLGAIQSHLGQRGGVPPFPLWKMMKNPGLTVRVLFSHHFQVQAKEVQARGSRHGSCVQSMHFGRPKSTNGIVPVVSEPTVQLCIHKEFLKC